jgi:hypothetical protein
VQRSEPRSRGVRLSDLDRSQVYRIAFVGRRWEVLGPESAPEACGDADVDGGSSDEVASTPYAPRHAAPAEGSEPSAPGAIGNPLGDVNSS